MIVGIGVVEDVGDGLALGPERLHPRGLSVVERIGVVRRNRRCSCTEVRTCVLAIAALSLTASDHYAVVMGSTVAVGQSCRRPETRRGVLHSPICDTATGIAAPVINAAITVVAQVACHSQAGSRRVKGW